MKGKSETTSMMRLGTLSSVVKKRLQIWEKSNFALRLWQKDPALWSENEFEPELVDRLGWLALPEVMQEQLDDLMAFADAVRSEGFRHVVLLGMGGSSLAPEVMQKTFGNASGYPELIVLDSTHPMAVRAVEARVELSKTLFLVSSKSGTTLETLSFFHYFWSRFRQSQQVPGSHFVAITDAGTPLIRLAQDRGFRHVFPSPPDVGGRYSALSVFGLLPAALIGLDLHRLADRARRMKEACASGVPVEQNPGLVLGAILGEAARAGKNKITLVTSSELASLSDWLEQLIAESTGKDGKGMVPVSGEAVGSPETYGSDRLFVEILLSGGNVNGRAISALESAGHPVVDINLSDRADIGGEFFRWEIAVASASAILGVHPFNQPDVQVAKELAHRAMETTQPETRKAGTDAKHMLDMAQKRNTLGRLNAWLDQSRRGDYLSIQAYLAPSPETEEALNKIRLSLRNRLCIATTLGYGPRFLHSTGQLHKGGANEGLFLQLVEEIVDDLAVPESSYSFGALIRAQAEGDYRALRQRRRRVLRINLGRDARGGIEQLSQALAI